MGTEQNVGLSKSEDWLPRGWTKEGKLRMKGKSAGHVDWYYIEPGTRRRLRSKKEVLEFIETGKFRHKAVRTKTTKTSFSAATNRVKKGVSKLIPIAEISLDLSEHKHNLLSEKSLHLLEKNLLQNEGFQDESKETVSTLATAIESEDGIVTNFQKSSEDKVYLKSKSNRQSTMSSLNIEKLFETEETFECFYNEAMLDFFEYGFDAASPLYVNESTPKDYLALEGTKQGTSTGGDADPFFFTDIDMKNSESSYIDIELGPSCMEELDKLFNCSEEQQGQHHMSAQLWSEVGSSQAGTKSFDDFTPCKITLEMSNK